MRSGKGSKQGRRPGEISPGSIQGPQGPSSTGSLLRGLASQAMTSPQAWGVLLDMDGTLGTSLKGPGDRVTAMAGLWVTCVCEPLFSSEQACLGWGALEPRRGAR